MNANHGNRKIEGGGTPGAGDGARLGSGLRHERMIGFYLAGCVALAVIAAALLLSSCGAKGEKRVASSDPGTSSSFESQAVPAVAAGGATSAMPAGLGAAALPQGSGDAPAAGSGEGLPPEIAIGEMEKVVAPGEAVAFTVYGTPDVTEMSLWDGLHDRQPFVLDRAAGVWRVDYRVPLRPKSERLGFSVTAKNDLGRWRRVWVFLQVASTAQAEAPAVPGEPAPADSVKEK